MRRLLLILGITLIACLPFSMAHAEKAAPALENIGKPVQTEAAMMKKPHPKWKKFWAEFRQGFKEEWDRPVAGGNQGDDGISTETQKAIAQFVKKEQLSFQDMGRMLSTAQEAIKQGNGEIPKEHLVKMFNGNKEFTDIIVNDLERVGPNWGRILGKIAARIIKGAIDVLLDNLNP